jgi:putative addiction module component (TIGR02574 family)
MAQSLPQLNVDELTVEQRLELIALLWDSIPDTLEAMPIPKWQRQELERRLADADAHPDTGIPWEEAKARLKGKL